MKKKITAIVLAAGSGRRMGGDIPKQYMELSGKPVIYYSLKVFQDSVVDDIVLVVSDEYIEYCRKEIVERYGFSKVTDIISGGRERYDSVRNGLEVCESADYVLIHDGARPFVKDKMIFDCVNALKIANGCLTALKATDTVKICENEAVKTTLDRNKIYFAQTPQGVDSKLYKKICESVSDTDFTDDASVLESSGEKVIIVNGDRSNIKITTPFDLVLAEAIVREEEKCE